MSAPVRIPGTTRINLSPNSFLKIPASFPEATSPLTPVLSARTANLRTAAQLLALRRRAITSMYMV